MATPTFYQPSEIANPQFTPPVSKAGLSKGEEMSSAAGLLKTGVNLATDYAKSSSMSDIEKGITEEIAKYQAQSPTYQGLIKKNIENLEADLYGIKNNPSLSVDAMDSKVKEVTTQLNAETAKLTNARNQGTITPLELETRLDDLIRTRASQNPMFRKEIIAHGAQTKDLLGISSIVRQDIEFYNKLDQSRKENETRIYKLAEDYKLDLRDFKDPLTGQTDLLAVEAEGNKRRGIMGIKLMGDTLSGMKDIETKLTKQDLLNYDAPNKYLVGTMMTLQNDLTKLWDTPTTEQNLNSRLQQADTLILAEKNKMNNFLSKYRNDKDLAWIRDDFDSMSNSLKENYKNIHTGKEMKEFFENGFSAIRAKQNLGLAQKVDMAEFNFQMEFLKNAGPNLTNAQKDESTKLLQIIANQFALSHATNNLQLSDKVLEDSFSKKLPDGRTQSDILLKTAFDSLLKTDPTNPMYSKVVQTYTDMLHMGSVWVDSGKVSGNQKLYDADKIVVNLADSRLKAKNVQFTEEVKGNLTSLISNYAKEVDTQISSLKGKPDGIIISTSPDGSLTARKDPNVPVANQAEQNLYINKFNGVVLTRINNSMKAYANLNNTDTKAIASEFLTRFYGSTFSNLVKSEADAVPGLTEKQKKANEILLGQ